MDASVRDIPTFAGLSASDLAGACVNAHVAIARPLRTFGRVLRELREAKGKKVWTQHYVARQAGVSIYTVNKAETGKPKVTVEMYDPICRALGTSIEAVADAADPTAPLPVSVRRHLGRTGGTKTLHDDQDPMYGVDTPATPAPNRTPEGEPDVDPDLNTILTHWKHLPIEQREAAADFVVTTYRKFRAQRGLPLKKVQG